MQHGAIEVASPQNRSSGYRGLSRFTKIQAATVSVADLRKLYVQLSEKTSEALEKYLAAQTKPDNLSQQQFDQLVNQARDNGRLMLIVIEDI